MSRNWRHGSTRAWRRTRAQVLARDSWECQLRLDGCTTLATHVHHTHGRGITGDDPAHLVATCAHCNLATGDPTRQPDPTPRPRTRW